MPKMKSFTVPLLKPRQNRHGQSADPSSGYTEEQIAEANRRHDRENGWSIHFGALYTNPLRLPETTLAPPWDKPVTEADLP